MLRLHPELNLNMSEPQLNTSFNYFRFKLHLLVVLHILMQISKKNKVFLFPHQPSTKTTSCLSASASCRLGLQLPVCLPEVSCSETFSSTFIKTSLRMGGRDEQKAQLIILLQASQTEESPSLLQSVRAAGSLTGRFPQNHHPP